MKKDIDPAFALSLKIEAVKERIFHLDDRYVGLMKYLPQLEHRSPEHCKKVIQNISDTVGQWTLQLILLRQLQAEREVIWQDRE